MRNNYKLRKRQEKETIVKATTSATTKRNKRNATTNTNTDPITTNTTNTTTSTSISDSHEPPQSIQDQGYVRPRILILCPYRSSARKIIEQIINILGPNTTVSNMAKFYDEFGNNYVHEDNDSNIKNSNGEKKKSKKVHRPASKPSDYQELFHDNIDDDFKIGIQINPGQGKGNGVDKGVYLRLFSDFDMSDIILASPIGLKLVVETSQNNTLNFDFLSSLEIIMLHQADVLYMQNWEHVQYILNQTNQLPKMDHNTDFSRIRPYFLENGSEKGYQYRQVLITSYFTEPLIQASFRQFCHSHNGCIKLKKKWNNQQGCIANVNLHVKQIFQKITTTSLENLEDERFSYFNNNILSQLIRYNQTRTLIIAPSYFHYVRIRNELLRREVDAAFICEYSRETEISRGRSRFFDGHKKILLYSGRAHFFR